MNPVVKYLGFAAGVILILLASAISGWTVRGWRCDSAMADYKQEQAGNAEKQREKSNAIEAKQEVVTQQSTSRLDEQQAAKQKEIVYVNKEVIKYRDRWRDRTCQRPDDWVQLYNASLFGTDPAMPEASKAGSTPDSATMLLPAGRN